VRITGLKLKGASLLPPASRRRSAGVRCDNFPMSGSDPAPRESGAPRVGIHRGALAGALSSAVQASSVALRLDCDIDRIAQDTNGVSVGSRAAAAGGVFDLAVVADGAFSQLRAQLPIAQRTTLYPCSPPTPMSG